MSRSDDAAPRTPRAAGKSIYEGILDVLLTGVAIIVPLVVTVYVLDVAVGLVVDALAPFVGVLQWLGVIGWLDLGAVAGPLLDVGVYSVIVDVFTELVAVVVLLGAVLLVGSLGRNRYGELLIGSLDGAIASIPGVGTVYRSFRRMGDVVLDTDVENFEELVLVEGPGAESYVLGFVTGRSPAAVHEAIGDDGTGGHDEMVSVFVPMAPNPVTGGVLAHVPRDRLLDVDMTIEEGVRSVLTSGIASDRRTDGPREVSVDDLARRLGDSPFGPDTAPIRLSDPEDADATESERS